MRKMLEEYRVDKLLRECKYNLKGTIPFSTEIMKELLDTIVKNNPETTLNTLYDVSLRSLELQGYTTSCENTEDQLLKFNDYYAVNYMVEQLISRHSTFKNINKYFACVTKEVSEGDIQKFQELFQIKIYDDCNFDADPNNTTMATLEEFAVKALEETIEELEKEFQNDAIIQENVIHQYCNELLNLAVENYQKSLEMQEKINSFVDTSKHISNLANASVTTNIHTVRQIVMEMQEIDAPVQNDLATELFNSLYY